MSCVAGRYGRIQIRKKGVGSFVNLGLIVDMSLSGNVDELECTSHDSSTREFVPNFFDATMDVSCRYCATDAGQIIIFDNSIVAPAILEIQFDLPGTLSAPITGDLRFAADAFATSPSWEAPLDDTLMFNTTFRLSDVVKTTVP